MAKAGKNKVAKILSAAVWRVKEKSRPYSGASIGDYLQVAIFNMTGTDSRGKPNMHALSTKYKLTEKRS